MHYIVLKIGMEEFHEIAYFELYLIVIMLRVCTAVNVL